MTWREITAGQLAALKSPVIVDVRSPCEFKEENIDGAINVPLLSDLERAEVGTIYKQQGEVAARRRALRMISPKVPDLVDTICDLRNGRNSLVVHCWRGGLRSEAVASFLSVVGIDCWRLTGGYKAWRKMVLQDFESNNYDFKTVVVHGLTGVGKTEILQELTRIGHKVLDLEALANHRGSIFGAIGLDSQPSQKNFEDRLWHCLQKFGPELVFVEAESKKIGKLSLPEFLIDRMKSGINIYVVGSLSSRIDRLLTDYGRKLDQEMMQHCIDLVRRLKERLGGAVVHQIEEKLVAQDLSGALEDLLVLYYDPLYQNQIDKSRPFQLEVSSDDKMSAVRTIDEWLLHSNRVQSSCRV